MNEVLWGENPAGAVEAVILQAVLRPSRWFVHEHGLIGGYDCRQGQVPGTHRVGTVEPWENHCRRRDYQCHDCGNVEGRQEDGLEPQRHQAKDCRDHKSNYRNQHPVYVRIDVERVSIKPECDTNKGHRPGFNEHCHLVCARDRLQQFFRKEQSDCRCHRQDVARQLGL